MKANLYKYQGPVHHLDSVLERNWVAYTYASSEAKARNNIAYQYKRITNREPWSQICLPGEIKPVLATSFPNQISWNLDEYR